MGMPRILAIRKPVVRMGIGQRFSVEAALQAQHLPANLSIYTSANSCSGKTVCGSLCVRPDTACSQAHRPAFLPVNKAFIFNGFEIGLPTATRRFALQEARHDHHARSEERRVGKECRCVWAREQ